jgi:hypothetical protein
VHLPYHESDQVLGIAYNLLCGGTCLQDIEQRRQDEVYLDALNPERIPDPTAGDFCRRFTEADIEALQTAINATRVHSRTRGSKRSGSTISCGSKIPPSSTSSSTSRARWACARAFS